MNAEFARSYAELYRRHWWWRAREDFIAAAVSKLGLPPRARILDVGCGDGLFFDPLARFGEVDGVEISPDIVSRRRREKGRIHVCPFDASFDPPERYDLVLLLDVLEHLDGPQEALQRAVSLLRPGGRVLITVPAFRGLWSAHDDLNDHRDRYTRRQFAALANRAGLKIERTEYFFQWLFAAKLLVRLRERLLGKKLSVPRVPRRPVNWLLYQVSRLELRWLARLGLPFGSSLLVVGQAAERRENRLAHPARLLAERRRHEWSEHPGVAAATAAHL
jgi:2-polyprenyl-3-methyl-5-hydroxy-6-metoxy-1,4-benzoquinol methylase